MKNPLFSCCALAACMLLVVASLCLMTTSCCDDGDLGDLYGKWQLVETESYLNFENSICQMQIVRAERHEVSSVWTTFIRRSDSIYFQVREADYMAGTPEVNGLDEAQLLSKFFGFQVDDGRLSFACQVSSSRLILTRGTRVWQFRQYGY